MHPALTQLDLHADIRETHSAVVVLIGDRAYKIKKPVDLGFLDFRSPDSRKRAVERELILNRRMAPDVYLDAARLRGIEGTDLEHVLVMRRMPEDRRLTRMLTDATTDRLRHELRRVARMLADFHSRADRSAQISAEAGPVGLRRRWTDNFDELAPFVGEAVDAAVFRRISQLALDYVDGRGMLFDRRAAARLYVDGHGDITAEDVFCLDDGPRVLDCIEFDDRLRWVDMLDDAAFLAMDLEYLGRPDLARWFLDQYVEYSAVATVNSLEEHYLGYRALVRAKVACLRAAQGNGGLQEDVDAHMLTALRHLQAGEVSLILVGGAPGTGKSTVAGMLADGIGAVLLSTDGLRDAIVGTGGPPDARYDEAARHRVYEGVLARAARALANGESVIVDATWGTAALRDLAVDTAARSRSRLLEFECHAPVDLAAARARRRAAEHGSASEAGPAIARRLAADREAWPSATPVDCSGSPREALRDVADVLSFAGPHDAESAWPTDVTPAQ